MPSGTAIKKIAPSARLIGCPGQRTAGEYPTPQHLTTPAPTCRCVGHFGFRLPTFFFSLALKTVLVLKTVCSSCSTPPPATPSSRSGCRDVSIIIARRRCVGARVRLRCAVAYDIKVQKSVTLRGLGADLLSPRCSGLFGFVENFLEVCGHGRPFGEYY